MTFIVQKAFEAHTSRMRGALASFATGFVFFGAMLMPEAAFARESEQNEQNEASDCVDPKHRHYVARSLTEPAPIRKKDKMRIRRVLM
jgi:hypothetical protein